MIEQIINDGKISLKDSGSIFLVLASFLERDNPINIEIENKNPYHLIFIKPKLKNVSPGDWKKAW